MPMATDGVFLPGGHEVLIRGYFSATTYAWPSMDKIASFRLPDQPQGEGVGAEPDGAAGTVYLSSEGLHSRVLRFDLPAKALSPAAAPTGAESTAPARKVTSRPAESDVSAGRPWWPWALGGVAGIAILGVLLRSLRPR